MDGANFELLLPMCERYCAVTIGRVRSACSSLRLRQSCDRRSPARCTHKLDMQQTWKTAAAKLEDTKPEFGNVFTKGTISPT